MAESTNFQYKHIATGAGGSTTVVAGTGAAGSQGTDNYAKQTVLHSLLVNNAAATAVITVYDWNATSGLVAGQVIAIITAPAGGLSSTFQAFDCIVSYGIVVVSATAATDLTVTYR